MDRFASHRMETFRMVAICGQVSEAARRLHLAQPTVTAQIRQLEEQAGQALFIRHAAGMRLTEAGIRLLDIAQRMHALLEEAESIGGPPPPSDPLVLGCSTTIAAYVLPPMLGPFLRLQGMRAVRMEVGNTDQVLRWVREGLLPLGAVEGLNRAPGLSLEPFMEDEIFPVRAAPARVPSAARSTARALAAVDRVEDLAGVPLLWREPGSGTRVVIERALAKALPGLGPRPGDLVLGHTEAIKGAVAEGLGIGFLSRWSIRAELQRGDLEIVSLPGLRIRRTFSWVHGGGALSGAAEAFHRHVGQWGQGSASHPGKPA